MVRLAERFVLEREIGSGGMSRVFLGRDEVLDRPVAVKLLKSGYAETDIGVRFRREGRTAARLSHPNIVQVYDAGEGEFEGREVSYIVMEYVPGGDLKGLIDQRGALSGGDLARLSEVAAGLAHAHERGIVHRDIKPHNILLDETDRPKLADFGIARALDATYATRTGSYLGTALYSPPEQLRGEKVTPKSDVYSLGVTLYHAATGQPPFSGAPLEIASQHVSKKPTPPRQLNDAVSAPLEALILDCMKKDPDSRPTADEVRLRLTEAGRSVRAAQAYPEPSATEPTEDGGDRAPTSATQPGTAQRPTSGTVYAGRRDRRRGTLVALAVVAVLAGIGALAALTLLGGGDQSANVSGQNGGDQGQGGQNLQQGSPGQQAASPQTQSGQEGGSQADDGLTEEAAEQTIVDHYETAASDDYRDAWNFLSSRYQQEIGSPGRWTNQFRTLESVDFTSGPTARVNGNTATVSFSTRAVHTNRVDTPSLTARLVNEGDEWKIDGLS